MFQDEFLDIRKNRVVRTDGRKNFLDPLIFFSLPQILLGRCVSQAGTTSLETSQQGQNAFDCNSVDEMCNVDRSPHLYGGFHQSEAEQGQTDLLVEAIFPPGSADRCQLSRYTPTGAVVTYVVRIK